MFVIQFFWRILFIVVWVLGLRLSIWWIMWGFFFGNSFRICYGFLMCFFFLFEGLVVLEEVFFCFFFFGWDLFWWFWWFWWCWLCGSLFLFLFLVRNFFVLVVFRLFVDFVCVINLLGLWFGVGFVVNSLNELFVILGIFYGNCCKVM